MGHNEVLVLIYLVWVLGAEPCFSGERELSHAVIELLEACSDLSGDVLGHLLGSWDQRHLAWLVNIHHFGKVPLTGRFLVWHDLLGV